MNRPGAVTTILVGALLGSGCKQGRKAQPSSDPAADLAPPSPQPSPTPVPRPEARGDRNAVADDQLGTPGLEPAPRDGTIGGGGAAGPGKGASQAHGPARAMFAKRQVPGDRFAANLVRALPTPTANDAVSPLALGAALAMLATTASGETARELLTALGVTSSAGLDEAYGPRLAAMPWTARSVPEPEIDRQGLLRMANRLWFENSGGSAPAASPHAPLLRGSLAALALSVDPLSARGTINAWIADETGGDVTTFLPERPTLASAVLTSALTMQLAWQQAFDLTLTTPATFHAVDGEHVVAMMSQRSMLRIVDDERAWIVELPLARDGLVAWLIVPKGKHGLASIAGALSSDQLERWDQALAVHDVALRLPRFDAAVTLELAPVLRRLGLTDVQLADKADLPGLQPRGGWLNGGRRGYLGAVFHQAHVSFDERGAQPGPRGVSVAGALDADPPAPPLAITADRPFMFLVRDATRGTVVLAGRMVAPPA